MSETPNLNETMVVMSTASTISDCYFEKAVREVQRLNEVLASVDASTSLAQARRRARGGRTSW